MHARQLLVWSSIASDEQADGEGDSGYCNDHGACSHDGEPSVLSWCASRLIAFHIPQMQADEVVEVRACGAADSQSEASDGLDGSTW